MHGKAFKIAVFLLLALAAVYVLSLRDNTDGAGAVREQLEQARDTQQQITAGTEDAQARAEAVERRIEEADSRAAGLESSLDEAGRLIKECQQIVRGVRERAEEG